MGSIGCDCVRAAVEPDLDVFCICALDIAKAANAVRKSLPFLLARTVELNTAAPFQYSSISSNGLFLVSGTNNQVNTA